MSHMYKPYPSDGAWVAADSVSSNHLYDFPLEYRRTIRTVRRQDIFVAIDLKVSFNILHGKYLKILKTACSIIFILLT